MKSRILQSAAPMLLVIAFTPALCRAQAEINPDHFDGISNVSTVESKATFNRNPWQAYGSFFVPYEVRCGGAKLTPGYYSLSVRQSGRRDVVRLTPVGNGVRAQALEVTATPRLSSEGATGLVVDHAKQRRTLTAIRLHQPGLTLFLETGKEEAVSIDAELIPISSPVSRALEAGGN